MKKFNYIITLFFIKIEEKHNGKIVIFGHTGFYEPYFDGVKIGIDTSTVIFELLLF